MRRDSERGAAAVLVAVFMSLVLIVAAAIAVDLGMQRVVRADAQAVADVVALDAARLLGGRTAQEIISGDERHEPLADVVRESADRNADGPGDSPSANATLVFVDEDEEGVPRVRMSGATPTPVGPTEIPDAVLVTVSNSVAFAFAPGRGSATRTAVASQGDPGLCFSIGTKTLTLDTSQSALGPLLEHLLRIELDAVGYEGLVGLKDVSVPLLDLMVELNVGSVEQLLTTNVSLMRFVVAVADVLRAQGQTAAVALLEALEVGVPGLPISLGSILSLETAGELAGLTADVNVLDLLGVAVVAANKNQALDVTIPGIARVRVVEPPRIACGGVGATAQSSQVRLEVRTSLPTNELGLTDIGVNLDLHVGAGQAVLNQLRCGPESAIVGATTGAVTVSPVSQPAGTPIVRLGLTLGTFLGYIPGLGIILELALKALGLHTVHLDVDTTAEVATASESLEFLWPDDGSVPPMQGVPAHGVEDTLKLRGTSVKIATGGIVGLLGALLNPTLNALFGGIVEPAVNGIVNPLLTTVLRPVLNLLGIGLGVAEVAVLGRPQCDTARLIG